MVIMKISASFPHGMDASGSRGIQYIGR